MKEINGRGKGGARPGAGRKPYAEDMISRTYYLPRLADEKLIRLSKASGKSRSYVLMELLDNVAE